tara:strand:- start:590 stop:742 length:153 start_codon:yes stop_codon:yes gene_type:complete
MNRIKEISFSMDGPATKVFVSKLLSGATEDISIISGDDLKKLTNPRFYFL